MPQVSLENCSGTVIQKVLKFRSPEVSEFQIEPDAEIPSQLTPSIYHIVKGLDDGGRLFSMQYIYIYIRIILLPGRQSETSYRENVLHRT